MAAASFKEKPEKSHFFRGWQTDLDCGWETGSRLTAGTLDTVGGKDAFPVRRK